MNPSDNQAPFTYADLLTQLQALTSEQLTQPVKAWGEHPLRSVTHLEVLAENYVCEDGEAWPVSDFGPEAEDEEVYVEGGTVVLWTE